MKVKLNPAFEAMSGTLGEMVFREVRGKTVISRKASMNSEPTVGQTAHRERFKLAAAYGKSVMANEETRAMYEAIAKSKNMPVFALTIADYFNAPTIHDLDLSIYNGQPDNAINITTSDDFRVMTVHVSITDEQGNTIESGYAIESSEGSNYWNYVTTVAVPVNNNLTVRAVATDRPGGTAVKTQNVKF